MKSASDHSHDCRSSFIKQGENLVKRGAYAPDDFAKRLTRITRYIKRVRRPLESGVSDVSRIVFLLVCLFLDVFFAIWILQFCFVRHLHPEGTHEIILTIFAAVFLLIHLGLKLRDTFRRNSRPAKDQNDERVAKNHGSIKMIAPAKHAKPAVGSSKNNSTSSRRDSKKGA